MNELENNERCNKLLLIVAWITITLSSSLGLIIWRELASGEPYWWPWMIALGLIVIFTLTLFIKSLKPLRWFILIFIVIFFLGFGGGWQWGLIPLIRSSPIWINWTNEIPWALSAIMTHLLRLLPALFILLILFLIGRKRDNFFLVKGNIRALVEPSKLIGMKKPEPWTRIGFIFLVIFTVGTFLFLIFTTNYSLDDFIRTLPLIPIVMLIAAINAFNEEFTLRAAPLSEVRRVIGKQWSLAITTTFFALGHYYGVPNGILGVLLSGFLGWFLG
ncbi:MAG: CPBP family intramembrane glutamic endopeptidase, partial [Candidatus Hodarchaeota archaeon]